MKQIFILYNCVCLIMKLEFDKFEIISLWGESMKKGTSCTKVKILFKDCIFHVAVLYWFILHFLLNIKFEDKYEI